jgi:hypothetical protein
MAHSRAAKMGVSAQTAVSDTVYVGYSTAPGVSNYWSVGAVGGHTSSYAPQPTNADGKPRPGPNSGGVQNNTNGWWTFDHPVHGDSLQGWWPIRCYHLNVSGATRTDDQRPWWAPSFGNIANYVINEAHVPVGNPAWATTPGSRTFGVIGLWHSDPGNVVTDSIPGSNVQAPGWAPLGGSRSAWMGQRASGDLTVKDAITGNPFNAQATDFLGFSGSNTAFGNGTGKHFPGYGSAQDQMMYRDIPVSTNAADGLTITFKAKYWLSNQTDSGLKTRTGWYEGDPLSVAAGNFISAEAGIPANSAAPADSFQVYVGMGEDGTFHPSNSGGTAAIYDPMRRWFNEVLNKNARKSVFGVSDTLVTPATKTITLTGAEKVAFRNASTGCVRLVFRVHTNIPFDDENNLISTSNSFSSRGMGAAQVDDVTYQEGAGAVVPYGDFEVGSLNGDINNDPAVSAQSAWKTTGKPPGIYFHVHDLNALASRYFDLCGGPNAPTDICDIFGTVISMGDHDLNEAYAGLPGTCDQNGYWGMVGPTINFRTAGPTTANGWNLTGDETEATQDYYIQYTIYTGIFNLTVDAAVWQWGFQCYPAKSDNGSIGWGQIRLPGFRIFNPDPQCFEYGPTSDNANAAKANGCITTLNASGIPDSLRLFIMKLQFCYRFGVPDANCGTGAGLGLLDNMSLVILDGAPSLMSLDIWQPLTDTFPFNETTTPGTADFDTTSALVRMGLNVAQTTATTTRFDVLGDSMTVGANGQGDQIRVDLVFRVNPGPGNYVTKGNVASGLCVTPQLSGISRVAFTPGDNSFWDVFSSDPGDKASPGAVAQHFAAPSHWSPLVWNSARCDTGETTYFPVLGAGIDPSNGGQSATWSSTFHETDLDAINHPKRLAYVNNRRRPECFIVDTTLTSFVSSNIVCGTLPAYFRVIPYSRLGFNGDSMTTENVSIFPDGVFTPGTHVEYFFRREDLTGVNAGRVDLVPDTTVVYVQQEEANFDGHRWQEFNVLPDKWKDPAYGGAANACMLYADWNDRRGDEIVWTAVADSIGATRAADRGNNNGYAAKGGAGGADGNGLVNDPTTFVNKNKQAGSSWDMYGIKACESTNNGGSSLGNRSAYNDPSPLNLVKDKAAKSGPTKDMLNAYYKIILLLSGDLNSSILGPFKDRSADDTKLLKDFLSLSTSSAQKGLYCGGNGFAEDASAAGGAQLNLLTDFLGANVSLTGAAGYRTTSGNPNAVADVIPTSAILGGSSASTIYGVRNSCLYTLDVLALSGASTTPRAVVAANYQNYGIAGPYVSSIANVNLSTDPQQYITMLDGWDIFVLTSRFDVNTFGRLQYEYLTFANVFGSICAVQGTPLVTLDTPNTSTGQRYVDFVGNFSNNPLRSGSAIVRFGLAQADRVEVDVYDVSGRQVRKLADRMFPAGEHTLTWDGVNDQGQMVSRGVYFTQVKFVNRHFSDSKKLTVLK